MKTAHNIVKGSSFCGAIAAGYFLWIIMNLNKNFFLAITIFLVTCFLYVNLVCAQSQSEERNIFDAKKLTKDYNLPTDPKFQKALAQSLQVTAEDIKIPSRSERAVTEAAIWTKDYNLPTHSNFQKALIKRLGMTTEQLVSSTLNKYYSFSPTVLQIIKGDGGRLIKETDATELVVEAAGPELQEWMNRDRSQEMQEEDFSNYTKEELWQEFDRILTPRKIETCKESRTIAVRYKDMDPQPNKEDIKEIMKNNVLVLPQGAPRQKDFMATDFSEIFGDGIKVHHYTTKAADLLSLEVSDLDVECLPFRVRGTTENLFYYYGDDALKNYDESYTKNKNGKGKLHFAIEKRIRDFYIE